MNSRQIGLLARATVLLVALFLTAGVQAGPLMWDVEGVALRQGAGIGAYSVAQNSQGYSLVVWCDLRNGSDDLFAQLISPAGVPQWAEGGAVVAAHPSEQVNPVAVAVNGGWIVLWIDHRHGCGSNIDPGWGDIYAQKLSDSGQPLWADNEYSGVAVDVNTGTQVLHSDPLVAVADGNGGALVAWTGLVAWEYVVLAQHVSGSGQVLWASPLSVADTMHVCDFTVNGAGDAAGNLFLCWHEWSQGCRRLRVVKIAPDGQRVWGGSGRQANVGTISFAQRPWLCPDGEGGCYVVWVNADAGYDVRLQRLNADGAALWTTGGISVCPLPNSGRDIALALSRNGSAVDGCVLAWGFQRGLASNTEIYVQKVSPAGEMQWATDGVCVADHPCGGEDDHWRSETRVVSDLAGGVVCTWRDGLRGEVLDGDLYASRVSLGGMKSWSGDCTPVWASPAAQTSILPVAALNGAFVFWVDIASGSTTFRYQQLDPASGGPMLAPEGVWLHQGICGLAQSPRILRLSPGRYVVTWEDTRSWTDRQLYYQFFDDDGVAGEPVNGRPVTVEQRCLGQMRQYEASLCADGGGGFFVTYLETCVPIPSDIPRVMLGHVNAAGDVICSSVPVHDDSLFLGDEPPHCLPDGQGGCYVAWLAYDQTYSRQVWLQRLNADGQRLWSQPRQLFQTVNEDHAVEGVVAGPDGSCVIVSLGGVWDNRHVVSACIRPDGSEAWNTVVCEAAGDRETVRVLPDGAGGFYAAWSDYRPSSDFDLYAQHVTGAGLALWANDGVPVASSAEYPGDVGVAQDRHGNLFVAYSIPSTAADQIRLQKLNPDGGRIWENSGRLVCSPGPYTQQCAIESDAGDGVFICWTDYRQLRPHIYGTHLDSSGALVADPYWTISGGLISTSWDAQWEPVMCADGYGGMIVTYVDNKGIEEVIEPPQIYAQRVFDGFTSAPEPPAEAPREFALLQNYPNPFNPVTVIAFDLARDGRTTLEVFDVLGRRVRTLVDGMLPAGEHRVTLDAASLPSGTYIYRLQAVEFTQSRKMLLLK